MSTVDLTAATFTPTTEGSGVVLVDFWAAWCGPCRRFAPIFEQASVQHPDVVFAKVDTEAEQALAGSMGISSIPTLMIFRDGVLLYADAGALPAHALEDLIGKAKALDMDEVRATLAARTAS
ncbi:MAG TPA: thioredoxin [Actinotalea sp.]|nr:thioredoxin [Actinotalea sp.]